MLGVCCPPESAEQLEAFTFVLEQHFGDSEKAKKVSHEMHKELIEFSKKLKKAVDAAKDE